jgi:hypothetical protein
MSGGQMMGECLSKRENFHCVTREDLLAAVNTYGGLAARIAGQIAKGPSAYESFSGLRRPYQILMRRALLEYTRKGPLAYFGYSGHLLLKRLRHFVRIRLIAPMDQRIARTCQLLGYSEEEAREHVRRMDQERACWARLMYGVDLRDPRLYDVCLNIERLSMQGACDLLRQIMLQEDFQPTPESVAEAEEYYLATQALAALALDPRTAHFEVDASVSGGVLRLVGPYIPDAELRVLLSAVPQLAGINSVEYEPGYAPAFRFDSA